MIKPNLMQAIIGPLNSLKAILTRTLVGVAILALCSGLAWAQTPNGFLDFGTTANNTTATTANTGFGGLRVGTGGGGFTIQNPGQSIGNAGELRGIAPTGGSINSVGITSTEFGTAATTFTVSFELHLSGGGSGIWYFFAGNGAGFAAAQSATFTGNQIFTGIRWTFGASGAIATDNRNAGAWSATGITGTPFAQGTAYQVTIVGNNSAATVNYGASQSVAANTYDLWVNGTLVGDDLAKAQLAATTSVNAFRFYSESSVGNVAALAVDNIRWYNTCVLPPTHLAFVNAPTSGNTSVNLPSFTVEARSGSASGPVATAFTGATTLAKATGSGAISGTLAPNAVAGVSTYGNIQFNAADTYTMSVAAASPIVSATSGNVVVTSPATAPAAPTITTITPGNGQLSVAFTAGADGGSPITSYKYSTDGGATFLTRQIGSTGTPILITTLSSDGTTALANGTSYNIQIKAVNAIGDGTATASTAATPRTTPSAPSITSITPGNGQLSVAFTAGADGGSPITNYKYSTDNGASFTAVSPAATTSPILIVGLVNGTTYDVQIKAANVAGDGAASGTTQSIPIAPVTPTIVAFPATLASALTTTYGTPSSAGSFTASGSALSGDITITAPTDFEVSTTLGSGYGATVNLTPSSGTVPNTTIYVRLTATATVTGNHNSQSIGLTSPIATPQTVATAPSGNTVTAKALTISGLSATPKEYDGTTTATITGTPTYSGLENSESFPVTDTVTYSYATKTVGTAKPLTASGTYSAPSPNYTVTQPSFSTDITAKALTVTGATVTTKTYDTTTAATITGASLVGVISPDVASVTSGTFASANAGTGIDVTLILSGADLGNYSLTQPIGLTGDITKANQTIAFGALAGKTTADVPFTLTATASSGLAVSYTSSDTGVATVSGSTVTITGPGTTIITASQAGDANYNAATTVQQNLVVTSPPVTVAWNFTTASPANVPGNLTISDVTQGNNNGTTTLISGTSVSSGYTGVSGGNNAAAAAFTGALVTGTSTYFEFTLTPSSGYKVVVSAASFGTRSTGSGPQAYTLRSSADNYASDLFTGTIANNSTWGLKSHAGILITAGSATTFRLFGHSGTGATSLGTANWRIDDLQLVVTVSPKTTPTITTAPTASAITYGQALSASTLSGGVASTAGTFAFTTPATVPSVGGVVNQSVTFTPTDTASYLTPAPFSVSVRVNPAPGAMTMATTKDTAANLNANKLVLVASDAGVTLSVTAVSATTAQGGSANLAGGIITYTPPSFGSYPASDSFTYTLSDDVGGSSVGTVDVIVNASNVGSRILDLVVVPTVSATITASGIPNALYKIQKSDNSGGSWEDLGTATAAANGVIIYTDETLDPSGRWYRLAQ